MIKIMNFVQMGYYCRFVFVNYFNKILNDNKSDYDCQLGRTPGLMMKGNQKVKYIEFQANI